MSKTIDEKVVALKFNKKQFEAGVDSSLKKIDDLNKGLKLEGASKNLEKVAKTAGEMDMSKMEVSIDKVSAKIGFLNQIAVTFVERMTNGLIDMGKNIADTFAIRPVTTGFQEYELKMNSVQTIMASTGASIDTVSNYLEELNKYADQTSYSFSDMTESIGKFTNAGVSLDMAVAAIKGISNEAAVSGANANEASRAMYNFAQALSAGSVKLIDWKSIENANMATVEFKNELLKTAAEIGTVTRDAAGMYQVLTSNASGSAMKDTIDATHNFNDSLSYQWMTTDVLIKTLQRYADETTYIGKKAYAAAQEAKTFSDVMGSLEETAQSGWGETWELVVGDLEQAKALWTEWSNFFGEIIQAGSDARNELIGNAMRLQDADGITGRVALWEGVKNVLESLVSTLGAVKKGFEDVFPPLTDQQLRLAIEKFKQFSEVLKNDEERLEKIRRTFRGIFAVLDIFVTTIRFAFKVATTVISKFVEVATTLFFFFYQKLSEWGDNIDNATSGFNGWLRNIRDGYREFISYINGLNGGLTIENLLKGLGAFGKNVIARIFDFGAFTEAWKEFLNNLSKVFTNAEKNTQSAGDKLIAIAGNIIKFLAASANKILDIILRISKTITPEGILATGLSLALLTVVHTFTKFTGSLNEIADDVSNTLTSIQKTIKSVGTKIKTDAIWTFSKSIALLAGSVIMLAALDSKQLQDAAITIGLIMLMVTSMSIFMSKMTGNAKNSISYMTMLVGLSFALSTVSKTLMQFRSELSNEDDLTRPLVILGSIAAALGVLGKFLSSGSKAYWSGALSMLTFAFALKRLVSLILSMNGQEIGFAKGTIETLMALTGILIVIGKSMGKANFGSAVGLVTAVLSLNLMMSSLAKLGEYDTSAIERSLGNISKVLLVFAGLGAAFSLANLVATKIESLSDGSKTKTKKTSDNLKQIGSAILKMSASVAILAVGLRLFTTLDTEKMQAATESVSGLFKWFAILTAASILTGNNADKAGTMLSKMATACLKIGALVAIMTIWDDPDSLREPMRMVEELLLVMGAVVALSYFGQSDLSKTINSLTIAALALGTLVAAMSMLDPASMWGATAAVSVLTLAFGGMVALTKFAKPAKTMVAVLSLVVAGLAGIVFAMSELDVQNGLENAEGISLMLVAMSAAMILLDKTGGVSNGALKKLGIISLMVIACGGIMFALSEIKLGDISIKNAAILGGLLLALSAAFRLISTDYMFNTNIGSQIALMSLSLVSIGTVLGVLAGFNIDIGYKNALGLGLMLGELVLAFKLLSDDDILDYDAVMQADILSAAMIPLAAAAAIMGGTSPEGAIKKAESLGLMLGSIIVAMKLLQNQQVINKTVIVQLGIIEGLVAGLGFVIWKMRDVEPDTAIGIASSLSMMLLALSATAVIASGVGLVAKAGLAGLGVMAAMLGAMGIVVGVLSAIFKDETSRNKVMEDIDFGIEVLEKLAYGIGGLIGTIIGGILGGIENGRLKGVGEGLESLITSLSPFLTEVEGISESSITKMWAIGEAVKSFGEAMVYGNWETSLEMTATGFESLGDSVTKFTGAVSEIDTTASSQIDFAIDVMGKLTEAAMNFPDMGGLLQGIVGEKNMIAWGLQMPFLAAGIVSFTKKTKNIDTGDHIGQALDVMKKIAQASNDIPNTGGLLGDIIGNNDMGEWAKQMPLLANGLVSFCYRVKEIDNTPNAGFAVDIMKKMAEAASKIPNSGGLLGSLFVNVESMKDFSDNAGGLGQGIADFCANTKDVEPNDNMDDIFTSLGGMITLANDLSGMSMNAEADIKAFGTMLTGLGINILRYSNCIDKINDLDKVSQSATMINTLAEMANTVGKSNLKKMDKFGEELVKFGEDSLQSFSALFEKADMKSSGKSVAEGIIDGMKSKKPFFLTAVAEIITVIINTFDKSKETMSSVGGEYAESFINGLVNRMNSNYATGLLSNVGSNVAKGLSNGINNGTGNLETTASSAANVVKNTMEKEFEVHSPSKWAGRIGGYITEGLGNGLNNGMTNVIGGQTNTWNSLKDVVSSGAQGVTEAIGNGFNWGEIAAKADEGKEKIKQSLSDKGIWDFSASIGDNLTNAKDKWKEWLGFDGESMLDMFGFGDIQSQFEDAFSGIGDGISAGISASASGIGGGGGSGSSVSSSIENLSDQLALQFHKHFDYEPYIAIGEKIGETMAIASNGAIVDSTEALTETMQEAMDIAAMGIDQWKAWAEARKAYDKLSQNEELAGWKVLQEKYAEGTKERMEADKQVYSLQKSMVSATYNFIKQQIEDGKYYETLSLREEIEMWEQAQELYIEDSEQRKEIDKELYKLRKDLRQQDFEDAKNNLEKLKKINKLSLEEEISEWEKMFEYAVDEEEIRYEIEEKITDLRNQQYQQAKKQIQHLKHMDQLALGAELASYQALWKYVEEGSDEAIELTEKIYDLQKEINEAQADYDKSVSEAEEKALEDRLNAEKEYADNVRQVEEKLASDIANVQKEYEDAVANREKTLYSTWGLFDEVKDSDYDESIFMENLEMQVNAFKAWQEEMGILANRGLDKDLIDELEQMGPDALEKIRALNRMTDSQLTEYQKLWKRKYELAHQQAVDELEETRIDTVNKIEELKKAAEIELEEYRQSWEDTMSQINADCEAKLSELADEFAKKIGEIKSALEELEEMQMGMGVSHNTALAGAAASGGGTLGAVLGSVVSGGSAMGTAVGGLIGVAGGLMGGVLADGMQLGQKLGKSTTDGYSQGVSTGTNKVVSTVSKMTNAVTSTIKSGLGIKSPSKVTREFGEYTILGFINGMASKIGQVFGMGSRIVDTLNEGMTSTAEHLQTIINDELDFRPVITPVLDISDMENRMTNFDEILNHTPVYGAAWTSRMLERQNELSFSSKNDDVVEQLRAMREDLSHLGSRIEGMQIMLDTGTLVGEIANPIDSILGQKASRTNRERGYF